MPLWVGWSRTLEVPPPQDLCHLVTYITNLGHALTLPGDAQARSESYTSLLITLPLVVQEFQGSPENEMCTTNCGEHMCFWYKWRCPHSPWACPLCGTPSRGCGGNPLWCPRTTLGCHVFNLPSLEQDICQGPKVFPQLSSWTLGFWIWVSLKGFSSSPRRVPLLATCKGRQPLVGSP